MPTKLFGVAYRRSMTASGTTVRTSTSPAARAASDTGGTGGDANAAPGAAQTAVHRVARTPDRKSTRLNSSHMSIAYAVFCLKKKKQKTKKKHCSNRTRREKPH